MKRFRFSIASLIRFTLICGVAFAALKESNDWWEKGTFTLVVLALLSAVLLAIHRDGARRAFWIGFALFGLVYLSLSVIPPVEARLISSQGLGYLHSKLPGQPIQNIVFTVTTTAPAPANLQTLTSGAFNSSGTVFTTARNGSVRVWNAATGKPLSSWGGSPENFVKIGHTFIALLLACFGGMLSRRLAGASVTAAIPDPNAASEP
jgi:hypothetical protein